MRNCVFSPVLLQELREWQINYLLIAECKQRRCCLQGFSHKKWLKHANLLWQVFVLTDVWAGGNEDAAASIDESGDGLHVDVSTKIWKCMPEIHD